MLSQPAFLEALGWAILNSWWQFGLLWIIILFIKKVLPGSVAALRYNLSLGLLITGIAWTIISFLLRWNRLMDEGFHFVGITSNYFNNWYSIADNYLSIATPYISILYLACLSYHLIRFLRLFLFSRDLRTAGLHKSPVQWRLFLTEMSAHMNIKNVVQLWISEKIDTPLIVGWLKPVILLPVTAVNQLSTDQLEAILIHELAHIKRNDYFWNLIVTLSEVVYYFNPFARWLIQEIRIEREHSCDDWVLQFSYKPEQYAHALLKLEQQRIGQQSQLMLAARGSSRNLLLSRVKRILNLPVKSSENQGIFKFITIVAIFLCLVVFIEPRKEIEQFLEVTLPSQPASKESNGQFVQGLPLTNDLPAETNSFPKPTHKKALNQAKKRATSDGKVQFPVEMANYSEVGNNIAEGFEKAVFIKEDRAYSLVEADPKKTKPPVITDKSPYIPRSSFQVLTQQDTIIPEAVLAQKLASIQEKEVVLQFKLAQAQQYLNKVQQEQIDNFDVSAKYNLKKEQLEEIQIQVEKQARQYEQLLEKRAKTVEEQLQKSIRKRKIVHI